MPFNGPQPCQSDSVQASQWCNKSLGLASGNQGYPLNPGLTRYGDINESLCFVHRSKLDTHCARLMYTLQSSLTYTG